MRLLIVEDHLEMLASLAQGFTEEGYEVDTACTGNEALEQLGRHSYAVMILDVLMPGLDGFSTLRACRSMGSQTPVLMLTSKGAVEDRLQGFNCGADDYLVKPFAFQELSARIRAIIARSSDSTEHALHIENVCIDLRAQVIYVDGEVVFFPKQEYTLLIALANHRGRAVSREYLYERLDEDSETGSNLLDVLIYNLRKKLGKDFIKTVRGHGYMIAATS